jgi:predicted ATP-binding protein involved in virulence
MKIKKISVENLWNKHTFSINFNKDVTILIGKNGSGKSTVLNLIDELLSSGRNNKNYKFKKIKLLSFNNKEISVEQKNIQFNNEMDRLDSISNESINELKKLFDRLQKDIISQSFNEKGISSSRKLKKQLSNEEIDYIFLSTFDMEVKNKELVEKHYSGKSYIKTELDVILNDLITNFKLYLLKIKGDVEEIQKEFDEELKLYISSAEGLQEKLLEKNRNIDKIYQNRDLFKDKINELFQDTDKHITLDENNSIVFQLDDKSYLTPYQLSSGEKQMLIIMLNIMLLENKPTILLMDEPEISLHVEWQRVFIEMLLALNPNLQIIIATHSPAIVSKNFRSKVVSLSNFRVKD